MARSLGTQHCRTQGQKYWPWQVASSLPVHQSRQTRHTPNLHHTYQTLVIKVAWTQGPVTPLVLNIQVSQISRGAIPQICTKKLSEQAVELFGCHGIMPDCNAPLPSQFLGITGRFQKTVKASRIDTSIHGLVLPNMKPRRKNIGQTRHIALRFCSTVP